MIWESTSSGFLNAMNGAFEAAYSAASDPRIANNLSVTRALAAAKRAHTDAIEAASVADATSGFFQSIKAARDASKAAYLASTAEAKLRTAIKEAYAEADAAKFNKGTQNRDLEYVAAELYRAAVIEEANSLKLADLHLDLSEKQSDLFFSKYALYCEAVALRVLLTETRANKSLLHEFEKFVFGTDPTGKAANKLKAIKVAMEDLDELFSQKKEFTWARNWLLDIEHNETNPITLQMFVLRVGYQTKMLRDLMPELNKLLPELELEKSP